MKSLIYFLIFIVVVCGAGVIHGAADKGVTKYQLSTHILDVNLGKPASGVPIILFKLSTDGENWSMRLAPKTGQLDLV